MAFKFAADWIFDDLEWWTVSRVRRSYSRANAPLHVQRRTNQHTHSLAPKKKETLIFPVLSYFETRIDIVD